MIRWPSMRQSARSDKARRLPMRGLRVRRTAGSRLSGPPDLDFTTSRERPGDASPDVADAGAEHMVGVAAGEIAVIAQVDVGALGDPRVGAEAQHDTVARRLRPQCTGGGAV